MMAPTFSIITICRNAERYLESTLASVLGQEFRDLELIVIDGASTDGTIPLISNHAARDRRIRWLSEPDDGIAAAMNKGIGLARGSIIAHLHADDFYPDPRVLGDVASALAADRGSHWLTGGALRVDATGERLNQIRVRRFSRRRLVRGNLIIHPATFIRREAFSKAGVFDPGLCYAMDYDLWLRLAALGPPLQINRPLAAVRIHPGSISAARHEECKAEEFAVRSRFIGRQESLLFHRGYFLLKMWLERIRLRRLMTPDESASRSDRCRG